MTPDEIAAERERFEKIAPHCGFPCPKPVAGVAYTFMPTPFAYASTNDGWQLWMRRAEIARAEHAELRAENERVRELAKGYLRVLLTLVCDRSRCTETTVWRSIKTPQPGSVSEMLLKLAEEAGVWFDDGGDEVPIDKWRERMGGVG